MINKAEQKRLQDAYGSWAVVTGATDGIGKAIAENLAQAHFNLVLVARRQSILEQLQREWTQQYDIDIRIVSADLAQTEGVRRVFAETEGLDVGLLIASAGFGTSGHFVNNSIEQELTMIDLNCRSVVEMTYQYAHHFIDRGRGGIVLFSSLVAFQGVETAANYAATKAFVQSFAEGLAKELAPHGIDVLVSAPGPVASGFAARANMQMGATLTPEIVADGTLSALGRKTIVRPGFLSKFLEWSLALLPRSLRVQAMSQVMKSMTSHQAPHKTIQPGASA